MPASFANFLCENGIIKNNFKFMLTEVVYIATNPYIGKSYNFILPMKDYIMLKNSKTKHVNIRL